MRSRKRTDPHRRTALYRFFDEDDGLLYVGITVNTKKRWQYHAKEQATTWWPLAVRNTVKWFDTRLEAEKAERTAIQTEFPRYNVMHTERNNHTYGNRRSSVAVAGVSPTRGKAMLRTIRQHFPEEPFTQLDVLVLVPICRSAVGQNFRALLAREDVVAVGRRTRVGYAGLGEVLYVLPDSPYAGTREPIYQAVRDVQDGKLSRAVKPPKSGRGWVYGSYPNAAAFRTLEDARTAFEDRSFSRPDLAKLTGLSMPGLIKHVVSLEHHGFIRCVGREPLAGRSGHPPKLYVVTSKRVPEIASSKRSSGRASKVACTNFSAIPSPDQLVGFKEIADLLKSGRWGRPMSSKRVAQLADQDPDWPVPKAEWVVHDGAPVFQWALVAAYCKNRSMRYSQFTGVLGKEPRGYHLYLLAVDRFGEQPFTRSQLASVAGLTLPGVQGNVECLVSVGLFEMAGLEERSGRGSRSHLYRAVAEPDTARRGMPVAEVRKYDGMDEAQA